MIPNPFTALKISGTHHPLSFVWYLDSSASNHVTFSSANLSNLQNYNSNLQVHISDGEKLPITAIGDISHPLHLQHVLLSQSLSANLLYVGWVADNDCNVSFCRSDYVVQDQVSENHRKGALVWMSFSTSYAFPLT